METLAKKSLIWVTIASLLFLIFSAVRFGAAEFLSVEAHESMLELDFARQPPSAAQLEAVARQLEIALFFAGENPGPHEDIAYLSLMRAALPDISPDEKKAQLQIGMSGLRTAIAVRPVSPYSWTLMLFVKRELGEFDAEFFHALRRSVELGPWEPELLESLADVGLSDWNEMPAAEQTLIRQVFVRGMKSQNRQVFDIIRSHQNGCALLAEDEKQKLGCQ